MQIPISSGAFRSPPGVKAQSSALPCATSSSTPAHSSSKAVPPVASVNETNAMLILIVAAVFLGLSLAATVLHIASGVVRRRRLISVDYVVVAAFTLFVGLNVEALVGVSLGAGKHIYVLDFSQIQELLKLFFAWRVTYPLAKGAAQLAILCALKETFNIKKPLYRYAWIYTTVLTVSFAAIAALTNLFTYHDVTKPLHDGLTSFLLRHNDLVVIVTNALFGASSAMTLALPLYPIWASRASWKRKSAMLGLWWVGFFNIWCVGAFITVMLYVVQAQDFTYTITDPLIISLIEVGAALVIASCPAVTGLFDYKGEGQDSASSLPDEEPGAVEDEDSESDSDITKPLLA